MLEAILKKRTVQRTIANDGITKVNTDDEGHHVVFSLRSPTGNAVIDAAVRCFCPIHDKFHSHATTPAGRFSLVVVCHEYEQ